MGHVFDLVDSLLNSGALELYKREPGSGNRQGEGGCHSV